MENFIGTSSVLETAALNEAELAEYCRQRGLYLKQVRARRKAGEQANDWERSQTRRLRETEQAKRQPSAGTDRASPGRPWRVPGLGIDYPDLQISTGLSLPGV